MMNVDPHGSTKIEFISLETKVQVTKPQCKGIIDLKNIAAFACHLRLKIKMALQLSSATTFEECRTVREL